MHVLGVCIVCTGKAESRCQLKCFFQQLHAVLLRRHRGHVGSMFMTSPPRLAHIRRILDSCLEVLKRAIFSTVHHELGQL